jgi:hypothetical protein
VLGALSCRDRKGSPIFLRIYNPKKWETYTVLVEEDSLPPEQGYIILISVMIYFLHGTKTKILLE